MPSQVDIVFLPSFSFNCHITQDRRMPSQMHCLDNSLLLRTRKSLNPSFPLTTWWPQLYWMWWYGWRRHLLKILAQVLDLITVCVFLSLFTNRSLTGDMGHSLLVTQVFPELQRWFSNVSGGPPRRKKSRLMWLPVMFAPATSLVISFQLVSLDPYQMT